MEHLFSVVLFILFLMLCRLYKVGLNLKRGRKSWQKNVLLKGARGKKVSHQSLPCCSLQSTLNSTSSATSLPGFSPTRPYGATVRRENLGTRLLITKFHSEACGWISCVRCDQPMDSSAHQILEKATQRQIRTRGKDRLNVTFVAVPFFWHWSRLFLTAVAFTFLNQSA